jgi:hypothetical protein
MVADTLGNLGTDQDGFDPTFEEAATIAGDMANVLESFDGELASAAASLPALDAGAVTGARAELASAAGATDAALADYQTAVPPIPDSGTSSTPPPAARTSISLPSDGPIGKVAGAGPIFVPGDAPAAIDYSGYDPTTMVGTMGAYIVPGFGSTDSITAAQLVDVSGGRVGVTLVTVFAGGSIQKYVSYLQFALDPAATSFGGKLAIQINNQPAWALIQYLFQNY